MRILHIWNTAGVASLIAKYTDRDFGTESLVIHRRAYDPYGLTTFGELLDCGPREFTIRAIAKARGYDIVHVHYFYKIVPYLRLFYPRKSIIMHFHGDDVRGKWKERRRYWKKANVVLYSTLDLKNHETPKHAIYLPNPVDTEIFRPHGMANEPRGAFHISHDVDDAAMELARSHGVELTIHDRRKNGPIPYTQLPLSLIHI